MGDLKTFCMGRRAPVARGPRMRFASYLAKGLPRPPASCDYSIAAKDVIANVYGNDQLGDCVIAGMAHLVGVMNANAGSSFAPTLDQVLALYSAIGGYDPSAPLVQTPDGPQNPTDHGCDEETALNFWAKNGAPIGSSHKIAGWLSVNASDPTEYRTALWLFENLFFGVSMPQPWVEPFPQSSGFVWNPAGQPNPQNGHCVVGVGYDGHGVKISTWGMTGTMTDAAVRAYATQNAGGGLYTVVSQDAINNATRKAPNGFAWSDLVSDFNAMGGNVVADDEGTVDWANLYGGVTA